MSTLPTLRTLQSRQASLASPAAQLRHLEGIPGLPGFEERLARSGCPPLRAAGIRVLQINVGKLCNQTCRHCHVDAGPARTEIMTRETAERCMSVLARTEIPVVDITGGAPELNPSFKYLVEESRRLGRHVIDRCNLSVLLLPSREDLAEYLAGHRVEVIASLPCYTEEMTDGQRGGGVFGRSIRALRRLNALGYGREGSGLVLNLIANPVGPKLPPPQASLEAAFRSRLGENYGVVFNRLFTMTNMPINRFLDSLVECGGDVEYMHRLEEAFNPEAAAGVMCRETLSVGWDGRLHDCDFNQMLGLPVAPGQPARIEDFVERLLERRPIVTGSHCYGCTAGDGSSCGGALA